MQSAPGGDTHRHLPVRVLIFALAAEVGAPRSPLSAVGVAAEFTIAAISGRRPLGSPTPAPADGGVLSCRGVPNSKRRKQSLAAVGSKTLPSLFISTAMRHNLHVLKTHYRRQIVCLRLPYIKSLGSSRDTKTAL